MLKNLLLGTIPYDDGTKKLVIKWFGTQECASWVVINNKKCIIWRNEHQVERVIDG